MKRKIFLYSLPRSGSTLLQKFLARNNYIDTISEPWIALPLIYLFKKDKVFSEYEHHLFCRAFDDLELQEIHVEEVRRKVIKSALDAYYEAVCDKHASVFIDKTPRYSVVCQDLYCIYPDDLHIVLFRNPLASVSSMVKTFGGGNWCLYRFDIDLFQGLRNLIDLSKGGDDPNLLVISYEDFLNDPELFYRKVCEKLGVDMDDKVDLSKVSLEGSLGDPTGGRKYGNKVTKNVYDDSWPSSFNTLYRRLWARRFVKKIGGGELGYMGYDAEELLRSIKFSSYSIKQEIIDIPHIALGFLHKYTGIYVTYTKLKMALGRAPVFGVR